MAWHRSCMKTGSGPAPTPVTAPEFVVEYEDIAIDGSTKTWTVVHPGLYFLEVIGAYQNALLSVSSSNTPYFDHTLQSYPKVRYMCIDLDTGDVVTYSGDNSRSLFHAIRFTNCSFDSIIVESGIKDGWIEQNVPSADGAYFMYGSCCGRYGHTQIDQSVASGDCNIYSVSTSDGCAMAHIIACTNQSSSAKIKMYGYDHGGSSVVCLKMANVSPAPTPTGYNIPSIELIYNSPLIIASETYTITTDGLYFIAVGFTHKGSGTLVLPQDVTPIRQQYLSTSYSGVQRGVKYALTRLSMGDVITIGSTADDWRGHYRYIIKLDDNLTITPMPVNESIIDDALTTHTIADNDCHLIFSMDTSMHGYDSENYQKLESSVEEVGLWFTTGDSRGKCHVGIISNAANKATYYGYGYNGGFSSLIDFVCSYSSN